MTYWYHNFCLWLNTLDWLSRLQCLVKSYLGLVCLLLHEGLNDCFSILSPNITIDFLLFELMSRLLTDELSSLLSAFTLVDALSAFLCNGVDCFRSLCVLFLFSFFTLSVLLFSDFLADSVNLESVINSVWVDIVLEFLLCDAESYYFDSWFNKESVTLYFLFICSFRKSMFSSTKMISLSKLFDLLTLSVVYDVSNCFLKTFTSAKNDFLNVWKSFFRLTGILIDCIYSIGNLIFIYNIAVVFFIFFASSTNNFNNLLSLFNWDSFGSDKQVLFPSTFTFTYCFSINLYKRLSKISLEISFPRELLTNSKTSSFSHFLLLRLSGCTEAISVWKSWVFQVPHLAYFPVVHARIFLPSNCYLLAIVFLLMFPF